MTLSVRLLVIAVASLWVTAASAQSNNNAIKFKMERKRFDVSREKTPNSTVNKEMWGYAIQLDNASFKDLAKVEVRYIIYSEEGIPGDKTGTLKEKLRPGNVAVGDFKKNTVYKFETATVDLSKERLDANWSYGSGASDRSKASITGIWIRVYIGGELLSQTSTPPSLMRDRKWKD